MWFDWMKHKRHGLHGWVLYALEISPKNGAEIMDAMEQMSQGWWRPSPGSIYPLLDELQKEGNIKKLEDGKYEITAQGRQEFEWPWGPRPKQPRTAEDIVAEMNSYVSYLEDLNRSEDRPKLTASAEKLKGVRDRLSALLDSVSADKL